MIVQSNIKGGYVLGEKKPFKHIPDIVKVSLYRLLAGIFIAIIVVLIMYLTGCSMSQQDGGKVEDIDFTVVENQDVPDELMKLIKEKKQNTLRLTYTTKDYTYMVAGYGSQPTSGYSIKVNDVYLGKNAIYVDVSLIGPAAGEQVNEMPTTPYIVIKIEKRDEPVIFKI